MGRRVKAGEFVGLDPVTGDEIWLRSETWEFDNATGELKSHTDPLGRRVDFTGYDNWGRLTESKRYVSGVVNDVTRSTYDHYGRLAANTLRATESDPITTSYQYDDLDRLRKEINAFGAEVEYFYDARGFLQKKDNEWNQPSYFLYDDLGRIEAAWDHGNSATSESTRYQYDAMDRVEYMTDPLNNVTQYVYDSLGRLVERHDPAISAGSPVTQFGYDDDGNLASLTDPAGNVTNWTYDHRNRVTKESITVNSSTLTREYQYNAADQVVWEKDRNDRWKNYVVSFAFGAPGNYRTDREVWWTQANGYDNWIVHEYNQGNGLLMTAVADQNAAVNPSGIDSRVEFSYDGLARMTNVRDFIDPVPNAANTTFELTYTWDTLDRRIYTDTSFNDRDSSGTVTATTGDFENRYTWNKLHRVTRVEQFTPSAADPNVEDQTLRKTVDIEYYAHGALKKFTRTQGLGASASAPLVTDYILEPPEWNWEGKISRIVHSGFEGGTSENRVLVFEYDTHRRMTDLKEHHGSTQDPSTLFNSQTFGYDATDQVTSVTDGATTEESYSYDLNGNRTNTGYATDDFNRVTNDGTNSYLYDNEGNRTRRTKISTGEYEIFAWNFRNRLTSVTFRNAQGATTKYVSYEYDGLDRRIRRKEQNYDPPGTPGPVVAQVRYLYDTDVREPGFWEVALVIDELTMYSGPSGGATMPGEIAHRFLNGPMVDQVFADETAVGDILWYVFDHQNTVRDVAVFDGTPGDQAKVVNHLTYDSFGNVVDADDPTTGTASDGDLPGTSGQHAPDRSYTGREPDAVTGLIYYRARWYDPALGRFISEDPIGFAAGDTNLSRYVGNSTPNATDPSGLDYYSEALGRLDREIFYWNAIANDIWGRYATVSRWLTLAGQSTLTGQGAGFAPYPFMQQHGLSRAEYDRYVQRLWNERARLEQHFGVADETLSGLYRERDRLRQEAAERSRSRSRNEGSNSNRRDSGNTFCPPEKWTTGWVHVYDPDGEWLATFEYDKSDPEETDLAMALADRTKAGVTAERLGQIVSSSIDTGVEIGVRVAFDAVDNVMSAVEFAEDPNWRTAAGMLPFVPGAIRKIPTPRLKSSPFGLKIEDAIPKNGVPRNWRREDIQDAIIDYRTSINSRKSEQRAFELAGTGTEVERLAHARRISEEESFLQSLLHALENRR